MDESSIESFLRDGSMRYTDRRGQQDTYISGICHPVSLPYLRGRTHSTRVYVHTCALPSPLGERRFHPIPPENGKPGVEKRSSGGMSRLSELLWLHNGHNMCVTYMSHWTHHRPFGRAWTWRVARRSASRIADGGIEARMIYRDIHAHSPFSVTRKR